MIDKPTTEAKTVAEGIFIMTCLAKPIPPIVGPNLTLRLIEPEDAAYVHALRIDPAYNLHLSEVRGTAKEQQRWIEAYKTREAEGHEYYFIIQRHDGQPCGTVRLYDFRGRRFTWGSWILDHNKPSKAALESACLLYAFAFDTLEMEEARFEVSSYNENTLSFHRRFGATETGRTAENVFFVYPQVRFEADREGYLAILER